jgi:hypothetical protein
MRYFILILVAFTVSILFFSTQVDFTDQEEDFIYLSKIIKKETKHESNIEKKLELLTTWLHENVKHVGKYPKNFNGKGVPNVIRGGVGNCGFQSCNIACLAEILGYGNHRIFHTRKELGASGQHAFCEINIDGKWTLYDPDYWQVLKNKDGNLVGVVDVIKDSTQVPDVKGSNRFIHTAISKKAYKLTKTWQKSQLAFGQEGYSNYEQFGISYFYIFKLKDNISDIIASFIVIFLLLLFLSNKIRKKKK